ncbi:MAG: DUF4399 domain-containing protein [Gammaproteobacteria bacterium]
MKTQSLRLLTILALGLTLAACGKPKPAAGAPSQAATQSTPAAPAESAPEPMPRSSSAEGASVAILSPKDGDVVSSPVKVVFDLKGMTLAPAGDPMPNSGHHHLLVDVAMPDLGQPIPKDAQHLHFGKAQTEAEITLPPGSHTLQLVLGDTNHVAHNPPVISAPITITVQ